MRDRSTTNPPPADGENAAVPEDYPLIQRILGGDDKAFDALYARYRLPLYAYLHKLLPKQPDPVDDFFQQTWIKATRSLERYRHQEKFFSWLCRIAHNIVIDYFRSHDSDATAELSEHLSTGDPRPDELIARKELAEALARRLRELPPEQQEVWNLRLDGLSFKEIAKRQHVGLNTALGRMHYAVINLRKLLAEHLRNFE